MKVSIILQEENRFLFICLFFRALIAYPHTSCIGLIMVEKGLLRLKKCIVIASLSFYYLFEGTQKNCLSEISVKRQSKGHNSVQIKEMQP